MAGVGRTLWSSLLPGRRSKDHPLRSGLPLSREKGGHWKESEQTGLLARLPSISHSPLSPFCPITFLCDFAFFIKASIKTLRFNCFLGVFISLWRLLCHIKLILNKFECFSLVNLSFVTEPQLRTQKGRRNRQFTSPAQLKEIFKNGKPPQLYF